MAEAAEPDALQSAHDSAADLLPVDTLREVAVTADGRGSTISVVTIDGTSAAILIGDGSSGTIIPS